MNEIFIPWPNAVYNVRLPQRRSRLGLMNHGALIVQNMGMCLVPGDIRPWKVINVRSYLQMTETNLSASKE